MSYEILPIGKYRARAIEAQLGETKTGKEQVVVRFELLNDGFEGQTITWFGVFATDKMAKRILEGLRACGWRGTDIGDLSGVTDCDVEIEVEHNTWEGKTSARVKWVNRIGGGPAVTPLAPDKARAFAARMKALATTVKPPEEKPGAGSTAPPTRSTQAAMGVSDDDIPF
ncbi:MAG TPA: DUF669 domain-containing protein [Planctomycetota bacterium]|nr:DUF669 domain-containing protein [Planctomycetota bacterium]